jgi:hypothetical protein
MNWKKQLKRPPLGAHTFPAATWPRNSRLKWHVEEVLCLEKSSTELQSLYLKNHAYKIIHFSVRALLCLPIAFSSLARNQNKKSNLLYLKNHKYKIIYFSVRGPLSLPIAFSLVASNQKKKLKFSILGKPSHRACENLEKLLVFSLKIVFVKSFHLN